MRFIPSEYFNELSRKKKKKATQIPRGGWANTSNGLKTVLPLGCKHPSAVQRVQTKGYYRTGKGSGGIPMAAGVKTKSRTSPYPWRKPDPPEKSSLTPRLQFPMNCSITQTVHHRH